jgi:hypothetical protein
MVICPIARAVHCTGCPLVKFCPAKTVLGDYGKDDRQSENKAAEEKRQESEKKPDDSGTSST